MRALKRPAVIVIALLAAGFVAISLWKRGERARGADPAAVGSSDLSDDRKAEIRRFWGVYRRATDFKNKGEWEKAAAGYREALAIDGRHEDALYYYGNMLFELADYDAAVGAWRALTEVNPFSTRAHLQLGAVHSCGLEGTPFDLTAAEREFARAHEINKEETGPIIKLGEIAVLTGEYGQARTYLETALQTNAKSVEAHYLLGYLEWREGDGEAALQFLQQALQLGRVERPAGQPLGEGDTRVGTGPILAEGAGRKSFFAPFWSALVEREGGVLSDADVEAEYQRLDDQMERLTGTPGGR